MSRTSAVGTWIINETIEPFHLTEENYYTYTLTGRIPYLDNCDLESIALSNSGSTMGRFYFSFSGSSGEISGYIGESVSSGGSLTAIRMFISGTSWGNMSMPLVTKQMRTVVITGGDDVADSDLISWLETNATFIDLYIPVDSPDGVRLATAKSYCETDIEVAPVLQVKSVAPSTSDQTVAADSGYAGLGEVKVGKIKLEEVGQTVTENGIVEIVPSEGEDGISKATVTVEVPTSTSSIQGDLLTYRVASDTEKVKAGDFVSIFNNYGEGNFSGAAADKIKICNVGNAAYVFFRDTDRGTNCVVRLSIDEGNVIVSPVMDLGNISVYYDVVALSESLFVLFYTDTECYSQQIKAINISIDLVNYTATYTDPATVAEVADDYTYLTAPKAVLSSSGKILICAFLYYRGNYNYYTYERFYDYDANAQTTTLLLSSAYCTSSSLISDPIVCGIKQLDVGHFAVAQRWDKYIYVRIVEVGETVQLGTQTQISYWGDTYDTFAMAVSGQDLYTFSYSSSSSTDKLFYLHHYEIDLEALTVTVKESSAGMPIEATSATMVALASGEIYMMYSKSSGLVYQKVVSSDGSWDYATEKSILNVSDTKAGDCIVLGNDSFLWCYGAPAGTFVQLNNNLESIDQKIVGNAYVSANVDKLTPFLGVAATNAATNELVKVYVPHRNIPIIVSVLTDSLSYVIDAVTMIAGQTVTVTFTALPPFILPDDVQVAGASYNWDASSGILTLFDVDVEDTAVIVVASGVNTANYTSSTTELSSGTDLTSSVECNVGDLIVAAIATRDTLTLSDGWTLISTSDINSTDTSSGNGHRLSWAWKIAESTEESITVTQASKQRLYINMVALQGATGVTDNGYSYVDNTTDPSITIEKPSGLVLWGLTAPFWSTSLPYPCWSASYSMPIIQLGSETQSRLGIGLDQSDETSVTFVSGDSAPYTVGSLTIEGMDKFYGA